MILIKLFYQFSLKISHLAHCVQLSDSLVNVLATVDDQAEQLLHLGLHGDHPKPDAHHIQGRRALPQAEG